MNGSKTSKLAVPLSTEKMLIVDFRRIYYLEAERKDTKVRLARKTYTIHRTLKALSGKLDERFVRIHRSFIVNIDHIYAIEDRGSSAFHVRLKPPVNKLLPVSETYTAMLGELFGF